MINKSFLDYSVVTVYRRCMSGVGNLRTEGQIRPAKPRHPARDPSAKTLIICNPVSYTHLTLPTILLV